MSRFGPWKFRKHFSDHNVKFLASSTGLLLSFFKKLYLCHKKNNTREKFKYAVSRTKIIFSRGFQLLDVSESEYCQFADSVYSMHFYVSDMSGTSYLCFVQIQRFSAIWFVHILLFWKAQTDALELWPCSVLLNWILPILACKREFMLGKKQDFGRCRFYVDNLQVLTIRLLLMEIHFL